MGMGPHFSGCDCIPTPVKYERGPDLNDYTIRDHIEGSNGCILLIQYHQCKNFGGIKLLVYEETWEEVKNLRLDPHFCQNCYGSPFARFEPTRKGMEAAIKTLENL